MSYKFDLSQLEIETDETEDHAQQVAEHLIIKKVSPRDPGDPMSEEMLRLAQTTFLSNTASVPRLVVFCGVEEENGSSSVCAGAGRAIAMISAKSVCLIDANVRSSPLSKTFGVNTATGIPGVASLHEQCFEIDRNLYLAGTEFLFDKRGVLFLVPELKRRIKQLQDVFEYVLIDAPANSISGDAIVLGQIADAAILVVEANSTRRTAARGSKDTLEAAGVRFLGTILRNQSFPLPKRLSDRL
jgi:succinoglycan biosynthesis transport protein ExoP